MWALQVMAPDRCAMVELAVPRPGPGQVLLRVEAVTTCPQWDLHLRHNAPMFAGHRFHYPYTPGQPGHEATGDVAAVGPGVTGWRRGQRASVWRDQGHHRQGCYAQYVVIDADNLIAVPEGIPPEGVAPLELAMCVGATFLMLRGATALAGATVGITGLGPAGLVAAQMARAEGAAAVMGFDPAPGRRAFALAAGLVDGAFDPREAPASVFPLRGDGTPQLDVAIDCAGGRRAVEFLLDRTRRVVALFGVQREDYLFAPRHWDGLWLCGYPGHGRAAAEYAVDLVASGRLRLGVLVSRQLPLAGYAEGVDLLERQEAIKVCFRPWWQA